MHTAVTALTGVASAVKVFLVTPSTAGVTQVVPTVFTGTSVIKVRNQKKTKFVVDDDDVSDLPVTYCFIDLVTNFS